MKPVWEVFKFSSASLKDMTRRLGRGLWTSCGFLRADKKLSLKADRVGIGSKQYISNENNDNKIILIISTKQELKFNREGFYCWKYQSWKKLLARSWKAL